MDAKMLKVGILFFGLIAIGGAAVILSSRTPKQEPPATKKLEERTIIIREGWNLNDIGEYLEKEGVVGKRAFLTAAAAFNDPSHPILQNRPKGASLEGFLFPDTYRIYDYKKSGVERSDATVAEEIIGKLLDNFSVKFTPQMDSMAATRGRSVFEVLTLASIIERETGRNATTDAQRRALDEERKIVAGIFYNRLRDGMALQSDATVNYVTGKNSPSPSLEDLEADSPYNTYTHTGLPPGPIGNPSLSSIWAALQPAETDYYYFLHKQPSGEPVYSRTFDEHVANKNRYLR